MQEIDLCGEWRLRMVPGGESLPARVPGCVHTDLLAAGKIPDPFVRDNEKRLQWIGRKEWLYSRTFEVSAHFLRHDRIVLSCEMLDTLAQVRINGRKAGRADNMFRLWEFDVRRLLRPGKNSIEVRFSSPFPYIEARQRRRWIGTGGSVIFDGSPWIRKEPCNFGWDWGPQLVTCGIQRPLRLIGFRKARLGEVSVRQRHGRSGSVSLDVEVVAERVGRASLTAAVSLWRQSGLKHEVSVRLREGRGRVRIPVKKPELWWPAGMGAQPLYEVTVDLLDEDKDLLDTDTKRIGLRRLELERRRDRWGESFRFSANGVPFFAKGANWIPADVFLSRLNTADYRRLLSDARAANMNMLRVWGGGIYEDDRFYDICDELGLCVWQDFMFACNPYPAFDREFMASVRLELGDNIRRLRHHPSIAFWCGNNEIEMISVGKKPGPRRMTWSENAKLFDRLIPAEVKRNDPDRDYWPSSPHTPRGERRDTNNPASGDAHLWSVWHGLRPFEWYRTALHRFVSEFGFQSFTEPKTTRAFTVPEDRNVTSPVMEHHQRSGIGNSVIMNYMLAWFRMPAGFDATIWLSQILQALAIKYGVEHWRRNMPRTMGALYWQLNDCWPVASWASIDFPGRWKALHYAAKRFFAPVLLSGVEDEKSGTLTLYSSNDTGQALPARLRWTVTDVAGKRLGRGARRVRVPARRSKALVRLNFSSLLAKHGAGDLLVWAELVSGGRTLSQDLFCFAKPKRMSLRDPGIRASVRRAPTGYAVTLRAKRPALWAWLELAGRDAVFTDNFVHLRPGRPVKINVYPARPLPAREMARRLRVGSLRDTYR